MSTPDDYPDTLRSTKPNLPSLDPRCTCKVVGTNRYRVTTCPVHRDEAGMGAVVRDTTTNPACGCDGCLGLTCDATEPGNVRDAERARSERLIEEVCSRMPDGAAQAGPIIAAIRGGDDA